MTRNILRYYGEYLITGTVSMLAAVVLINLVFQPTATTATAFTIFLACAPLLHIWQKRSTRAQLIVKHLGSLRLAYGLAALFLLALPLIWYRYIEDLSSPSGVVVEKVVARRGPETIQFPSAADHFLLILDRAAENAYSYYSVKILGPSDSDGREEWSRGGLAPTSTGDFTIKISRGFLSAGIHRILLFGNHDDGEELVAEYKIQIADD